MTLKDKVRNIPRVLRHNAVTSVQAGLKGTAAAKAHLHSHADPLNIPSDVASLCVSFRFAPGLKHRYARQSPSAKLSGSMSCRRRICSSPLTVRASCQLACKGRSRSCARFLSS